MELIAFRTSKACSDVFARTYKFVYLEKREMSLFSFFLCLGSEKWQTQEAIIKRLFIYLFIIISGKLL